MNFMDKDVTTKSVHTCPPLCNMLQTLGLTGFTCNQLRLQSQNSFDDVKLPVRITGVATVLIET